MVRLGLFLFLAAFAIPSGLAGPACSRKHKSASDCIQKCRARWGWSGTVMGTDPWGQVIHSTDNSVAAFESTIAAACGSPIPVGIPIGNVGNSISSTTTPELTTTSVLLPTTISEIRAESTSSTKSIQLSSPIPPPNTSTNVDIEPTPEPADFAPPQFAPPSFAPPQEFVPPSQATQGQPEPTPEPEPQTQPQPEPQPQQPQPQPQPVPQPEPQPQQPQPQPQNADIQVYLDGHNNLRRKHGANDLIWSDEAAAKALQWASACQFKHSGGTLGSFGENLAAGNGDTYGPNDGMDSWAAEVDQYNPNDPQSSHFTQMVWQGTTQVGCHMVENCSGIFNGGPPAKFIVCEYHPQGNIIGRFAQNVRV